MGRPKGSLNKSKGLGDTIEKVAKKTRVKKIVETVFKDCGCQERKEWLNKKFPYYNKVKNCMTKEQHAVFKDFKERSPKKLNQQDQDLIHSMYCSVFGVNVKPCVGCSSAQWRQFIIRLDGVYQNYQDGKENNIKKTA